MSPAINLILLSNIFDSYSGITPFTLTLRIEDPSLMIPLKTKVGEIALTSSLSEISLY